MDFPQKGLPDQKETSKPDTTVKKTSDEKTKNSKSLLSVLNSLQAQFENDDLPDIDRITRRHTLLPKDKTEEFKRLLKSKTSKIHETESPVIIQTQTQTPFQAQAQVQTQTQTHPVVELKNSRSEIRSTDNKRVRMKRDLSIDWIDKDIFLRKRNQNNNDKLANKKETVPVPESEPPKEEKKVEDKPLSMLEILARTFVKGEVLNHFNNKTMIKLFSMSMIALLVQLKFSKKARAWFLFTIQLLVYLTAFGVSAGTFAILALKYRIHRKNLQKNKSVQSQQQVQAQKDVQIQNQVAQHPNVLVRAEITTEQPIRLPVVQTDEQKVLNTISN